MKILCLIFIRSYIINSDRPVWSSRGGMGGTRSTRRNSRPYDEEASWYEKGLFPFLVNQQFINIQSTQEWEKWYPNAYPTHAKVPQTVGIDPNGTIEK